MKLGLEYDEIIHVESVEDFLDEKQSFLRIGNHFRIERNGSLSRSEDHHFLLTEYSLGAGDGGVSQHILLPE